MEKSVIEQGQPEHSVVTTCAYCGVGCSFRAEMKGTEVVRMVPNKDGQANHGHSCVKGRFAWGYATHPDRIIKPMIRSKITDPWKEVSWDEAIGYAAAEFKRIQAKYGRDSIGGITSSRCTNEETYLVQKLVRAAFGNNNVDTCARVCHSPTGYGLKQTLGESAGTQDFDSVEQADVIMVIGANPTDGHPVFASQMKRRLREGAKLIVVDPRDHRSGAPAARPGRLSPAAAARHQRRGDQRARARGGHRRAARKKITSRERCDLREYEKWKAFVREPRNSPEAMEPITGVPAADDPRRRAAVRRRRATPRSTTAWASPSTARARPWSSASPTSRWPRATSAGGRGRESAARPEQRAGLLRHGLVPARAAGLPARLRRRVRAMFE